MLYADSSLTDQDVIDILNETPGMPTSRDFVEYTYYANGACATMRDQRGVVHEYTYDNWNRVTLDHITDLGDAAEGVDDAVRGIATTYDLLGRTAAITSYGDTNDDGILDVVRNQIQYAYDDYDATLNPDGWGGVATVWQENDGAVNTSTSPNVQYDYDSLGRLTSVTDPDGLEVVYDYGAAGSIDNRLSRVAAVTNAAGTLEYAAYTYLGAGTIVGSSRELVVDGQNDQTLELTYGTAQNGYAGLDRFGRVVDQLWKLDGVAVDDYSYGYSQAGNRLWRENVVAGDQSVDLDELYSYDELSQLIATERGRLVFDDPNPGDVSLVDEVFGQEWSLDGLGNWVAFDDDGDAQTRETNAANEITAITGGSVTPAYDAAGNMISGPSPLDGTVRVHYAYDAWNRLVAVYADDSGEPGDLMAQYEYDGLNRRIMKTVYDGEDTTTSEYFYNESWQLLEARTTAGEDTSATHYAWDLSYIDAPIARLFDANADGDFADAADAVHYYTFDANQNVTALLGLVETSPGVFEWQVVERYVYTPYGIATAYDPDWSNPGAPTTDGPLYAGYHFDPETGLYHVRNRQYDPSLGAFTTRDPIGYAAGDANLYRYVGNGPINAIDSYGLQETTAAAEGRVAHQAIQEWLSDGGTTKFEVGTMREFPNKGEAVGRIDVVRGSKATEIGPGSITGLPAKERQLKSITANKAKQRSVILYKQTGNIPKAGATVRFVELPESTFSQLVKEAKDNRWCCEEIWARVKQLGKENACVVSERAANAAGWRHFRGVKYAAEAADSAAGVSKAAKRAGSAATREVARKASRGAGRAGASRIPVFGTIVTTGFVGYDLCTSPYDCDIDVLFHYRVDYAIESFLDSVMIVPLMPMSAEEWLEVQETRNQRAFDYEWQQKLPAPPPGTIIRRDGLNRVART